MKRILLFFLLVGSLLAQNPRTAKFPGALADDEDLLVGKDRAWSTLDLTVSDTDTVIPVATGDGSKFVAYSIITIQDEQIAICSISTDDLNVCSGGRGFSWTVAAQHLVGVSVRLNITSWHHNQVAAEVKAIQSELGVDMSGVLESDDGDFNSYTLKDPVVSLDILLIEDSESSYTKKKVLLSQLSELVGLTDTPSSYTAGRYLMANAGATAAEWDTEFYNDLSNDWLYMTEKVFMVDSPTDNETGFYIQHDINLPSGTLGVTGFLFKPIINVANNAPIAGFVCSMREDQERDNKSASGEHACFGGNHQATNASASAGTNIFGMDMHVGKTSEASTNIGLIAGAFAVHSETSVQNAIPSIGMHLYSNSHGALSAVRAGTALQIEGTAGWEWAIRYFLTGLAADNNIEPDFGVDQYGRIILTETEEVSDPGSDKAFIYAKDDEATTKVCFRDSAGVETCIGDGSGSGDVVGPAVAVDGEVAIYDGDTGKLIARGIGCTIAAGKITCTDGVSAGDGTSESMLTLPELATNGDNFFQFVGAADQDVNGCVIIEGQPTEDQMLRATSSTTVIDSITCRVIAWEDVPSGGSGASMEVSSWFPLGIGRVTTGDADTANVVRLYRTENTVERKLDIAGVSIGTNGAGNAAVCFYDSDKIKISNSEAKFTTGATGVFSTALSSTVTLTPGIYYVAFAVENADSFLALTQTGSIAGLMGAGAVDGVGTCANTADVSQAQGSIFPETCGAFTETPTETAFMISMWQ